MALTFAQAITAVRTATRYDTASPSPVTDAQVTVWMNQEMHRLRRLLNVEVPALYRTVSSTKTVNSGAQTISKDADFDTLVRIEKLIGSIWVNVEPAQSADFEHGDFGWEETAAGYNLWPSLAAPGSYRIVYGAGATEGTLATPAGLEDVIVERVSGRVKERLAPAEAALHFQIADRVLEEQLPLLRRRLGRNVASGFRPSYRAPVTRG